VDPPCQPSTGGVTTSAEARVDEPVTAASRAPHRDPIWARLLIVFGAVLMLVSGGVLVGGRTLLRQYADTLHQADILGGAARAGHVKIDGPLNILLVGVDERPDGTEPIRSDSIIIVHVNAAHDQAYLVSIPRDLVVDIPPYPKAGFPGGTDKINAAFAYGSQAGGGRNGGVELLGLTIKRNFAGITFDAGAIVDFGGFQSVVRALGGVDMCIDERVESHHVGTGPDGRFLAPDQGGRPVVYEPGCRHLEPWQALDYVRQRYGLPNGDYDRQRHQQQFLKAVLKEARDLGVTRNPMKLYQIMKASGNALTVDTHGLPVEDWVFALSGIAERDVVLLKTNAGQVNATTVHGESAEQLSEASATLFRSVQDDNLVQFITTHPEFVSSDGTTG
jgi:LCP family protein required for cell wall assembly